MIKKILIYVVSAIWFAGCVYTSSTQTGTVGVERKQLLVLSSKQMQQGANEAYSNIIAKSKKEGVLNTNKQTHKKLKVIADNLIAQVGIYRKDALKWKWEVNLIKSNQLNAWCMPGGKIAFYTGIIDKLKLTDGEIAAIMGHEISHALREHGRERASQSAITSTGLSLIGAYFGLGDIGGSLAQKVVDVTLTLPNSRLHEQEADRMGVELAARAGYNPYDAVNVWEKMSKMSGKQPPEILSTHPSNKSRIKDLKIYAQKVNHHYIKAKKS
jgi:Zn-dependent protease with chaperone function